MSIRLHIKDIALLKSLDEDHATRWTLAEIAGLFRTRTTFEESLHRLRQREFLRARQERGRVLAGRWVFIPANRTEARQVIAGADQVALDAQLLMLGRAGSLLPPVRTMSMRLPTCPVCQRRGWNQQQRAQETLSSGRVRGFASQLRAVVNDGDGQLRVYRCGPGLGLWHVTNLTDDEFQELIAPDFLVLPEAPQPIPGHGQADRWPDYQHRVAAELMVAIHAQQRGLAIPRTGVLVARYQVSTPWARGLLEDFASHGLLRKISGLYVTGTPRAHDEPAS